MGTPSKDENDGCSGFMFYALVIAATFIAGLYLKNNP